MRHLSGDAPGPGSKERLRVRVFTCDQQSSVPARLRPPSLQTHEADLQLLLVGLRPGEHPAVPGFLHHDGNETRTDLLIYSQPEDKAPRPARPGGSIAAAARRKEEKQQKGGEEEERNGRSAGGGGGGGGDGLQIG